MADCKIKRNTTLHKKDAAPAFNGNCLKQPYKGMQPMDQLIISSLNSCYLLRVSLNGHTLDRLVEIHQVTPYKSDIAHE